MDADAASSQTSGPGGTETARPHVPTPFQRRLPNALTIARVVMTIAFVAVLSVYRFPDVNAWALPTALVLFIVAALTDAADGYLARKWNAVSVFGRIVDPLADKVLVLGAFIMLAGPGFDAHGPFLSVNISGVAPWMVVVILSRELLVTTMRGALEGRGIDSSAMLSGKLKMIAQSIGVPLILVIVMGADRAYDDPYGQALREAAVRQQRLDQALASDDRASYEAAFSELIAWHKETLENPPRATPGEMIDRAERVERLGVVCAVITWAITIITALSVIPYITRALGAIGGSRENG